MRAEMTRNMGVDREEPWVRVYAPGLLNPLLLDHRWHTTTFVASQLKAR
jgi:hypothetical protein